MNQNNGNFQIRFLDNTSFNGNLFQKQWRMISDNKEIKDIVFTFGGSTIRMSDYLEYNLTYESIVIVGKKPQITNISLVGRKESSSDIIIFNFKTSTVDKKEISKYTEYGNMISDTWKKGIEKGDPKCFHG